MSTCESITIRTILAIIVNLGFFPRVMVEWGLKAAYLPDLANWQAHHATAPLQMTPSPPMHHLPLGLGALINCKNVDRIA